MQSSSIFQNRALVMLCTATFTAFFGRSMLRMLLPWWVLELTNSPYLLGIVNLLGNLPFAFGIVSGALIDRFNRRNILIYAGMSSVAVLSMMVFSLSAGFFQFWQIPAVALLDGIGSIFAYSARATLVPDLARKDNVKRANSLLMAFGSAASVLGPYIGGILLANIGYRGCLIIIDGFFLLEILILSSISSMNASIERHSPILSDLMKGVKYILSDQAILAVLLMSALWNLFITPFQGTLLPIAARNILNVNAAGLGLLQGGIGIGSLVGSLFLIGLKDIKHEGWLAIICSVLDGFFFIMLSRSYSFNVSLVFLVVIGCMNAIINTISMTSLLVHVIDENRGLVMGVRGQMISTMPLGSFMMGLEANSIGVLFAIMLNGTFFGVIMIGIGIFAPRFRRLE